MPPDMNMSPPDGKKEKKKELYQIKDKSKQKLSVEDILTGETITKKNK